MNHHHGILEHNSEAIQSIPSPPITISGSEVSSPCIPASSSSPQTPVRPATSKSPYEWMKKSSYQPNPGKWMNVSYYCKLSIFLHQTSRFKRKYKKKYMGMRMKDQTERFVQTKLLYCPNWIIKLKKNL